MVERLYPGVYVTEIAFQAKPIDGVSTSTAALTSAQAAAHEPVLAAPAWTDHNQGDPGVTLVELFAFLGESLLFRATGPIVHAQPGYGIAQGLAVESGDGRAGAQLKVSHGFALTSQGQPAESDTSRGDHHIKKP